MEIASNLAITDNNKHNRIKNIATIAGNRLLVNVFSFSFRSHWGRFQDNFRQSTATSLLDKRTRRPVLLAPVLCILETAHRAWGVCTPTAQNSPAIIKNTRKVHPLRGSTPTAPALRGCRLKHGGWADPQDTRPRLEGNH